jgi:hypothetical protein
VLSADQRAARFVFRNSRLRSDVRIHPMPSSRKAMVFSTSATYSRETFAMDS